MIIPWKELRSETLVAVVEEFVSRDGTDYGLEEVSFESKVKEVYRLLQTRKVAVVFDPETESCDIREILNGARQSTQSSTPSETS